MKQSTEHLLSITIQFSQIVNSIFANYIFNLRYLLLQNIRFKFLTFYKIGYFRLVRCISSSYYKISRCSFVLLLTLPSFSILFFWIIISVTQINLFKIYFPLIYLWNLLTFETSEHIFSVLA